VTHFWSDPNWWVNALVAIGTLAVAFVALFGDELKRRLFPPKLALDLVSNEGSRARIRLRDPQTGSERLEDARYYHIGVSNKGSIATDAGVYLILVKQKGAGEAWYTAWSGKALLSWPQTTMQPFPRSIGRTAINVNLVGLVKEKWLELMVVMPPNDLPSNSPPDSSAVPGRFRKPVELVVAVQALATEGQSQLKQFHIAWDGGWADGDKEITRHLIIEPAGGDEERGIPGY